MIGFVSRKARAFVTPRNASACIDASPGASKPAGAGKGAVPGNGAPPGKGGAVISKDAAAPADGKGVVLGRLAPAAAADKNAAAAAGGNGLKSIIASEPAGHAPGTFIGAALPICGVDVLIVVVYPWVLADIHEANLYVVAFGERFRRRIVLTAQGPDATPCFYGPTDIIRVLRGLPFEMLPWRRYLFRTTTPSAWRLPIPAPRGAARADCLDGALGEGGAAPAPIAGDRRAAPAAAPTPIAGDRRAAPAAAPTPIAGDRRADLTDVTPTAGDRRADLTDVTPTAGDRRADLTDATTPHRRARRVDHTPEH